MYFRQLALGTLMGLVAGVAAQAEDAIVADEFEQQQTINACDAYGAGFAKLPGTDICARVSGKVSVEKRFYNRSSSGGGQVQLDFETRSD